MKQELQKTEPHDSGIELHNSTINIYSGASMLQLSDEEEKKIKEPFPEDQVEIRPDGLIYLPQTFWRQRLNHSFGVGQWCLIVKGNHKDPATSKDKLYLQGVLMVRNCYISEAIGEAELQSNNPLQSWASVWESAKSDAITRCCKDLGIASELWQPQFIEGWKKKYAIPVKVEKKDKRSGKVEIKVQWRKKNSAPFWNEVKGNGFKVTQTQTTTEKKKESAPAQIPWLTEKQYNNILANIKNDTNVKESIRSIAKVQVKKEWQEDIRKAYHEYLKGKEKPKDAPQNTTDVSDAASHSTPSIAINMLCKIGTLKALTEYYENCDHLHSNKDFNDLFNKRKLELLTPQK